MELRREDSGQTAAAEPAERPLEPAPASPAEVGAGLSPQLAASLGNHRFGALLREIGSQAVMRQAAAAVADPAAQTGDTGPGTYVPHRYCRADAPPPNPAVEESEATCTELLGLAEAGLQRQRVRAESLLEGPEGPVRDFRYFFAKVYSFVTENEIRFVRERAYYYPSYVLRSVLYFEQIYEDNFNAWDRRQAGDLSVAPEDHWRIAFERAEQSRQLVAMAELVRSAIPVTSPIARSSAAMSAMMTSVIASARALTEGMKAHIRWDLPRAEAWVFNSYYSGQPGVRIADFATDFMSMSGVFDNAGRAMQDDMAEKLGVPVNLMPALIQDTTMRHLFDADMGTERADTWRRAELIQASSGTGPYAMGAEGLGGGDVTASNNRSEIDSLTPVSLRPDMDDSAAARADTSFLGLGSDDAIRAEVNRLGRAGLRSLGVVERVQMIRGLIVGGTFGEDEDAILTVLGASQDAGDLVIAVDAADAWELCFSLDGEQYTRLREDYLVPHYYGRTARQTAMRLIQKCLDGETANWEEDMVVDILDARADAGPIVTEIGALYPSGPDNHLSGVNKLEWQLDDDREARVRTRMRALGLRETSGYYFSQ